MNGLHHPTVTRYCLPLPTTYLAMPGIGAGVNVHRLVNNQPHPAPGPLLIVTGQLLVGIAINVIGTVRCQKNAVRNLYIADSYW